MNYSLFFYNLLLIILYSVNLSGYLHLYLRKRNPAFIWAAVLFGLYVLDVMFIFMTEYYHELANYYTSNLHFESIPKVIITLLIIFSYRQIAHYSIRINLLKIEYGMWASAFLASMFLFNIDFEQNIMMWIYSGLQQFLLFFTILISIVKLPNSDLPTTEQNRVRRILYVTLIILLVGLVEHIMILSTGSAVLKLFPNYMQRRTMIEILSIWVVGVGIYYLFKLFPAGGSIEKDEEALSLIMKEKQEKLEKILHQRVLLFGKKYSLTNREIEILELLAKHYTNQQISDSLYISLGTVKVHVHSIFQKTGITSRDQVEVHLQSLELNEKIDNESNRLNRKAGKKPQDLRNG